MSIQADVQSRIERERKKVAELRNEIVRREAFIQGLMAALDILSSGTASPGAASDSKEWLRPGSDVMKAQELLSKAGRPLYISEILTGIGKDDTKRNRASLGSSLARYARRGEIFRRGDRPNEFAVRSASALTEPKQAGDAEDVAQQLPAAFGSG